MRLRLILLLPLLLVLVLFALSNTTVVPIGLWPTGLAIEAPVAVAILIGMGFAFLVGALTMWTGSLGHRRRARRAEARLFAVQAELETLRAGGASALATLPGR